MVPQVLFNHARASRGPWRIRCFIDREGHAFTNNYNTVRPKETSVSLDALWAIVNSPLANAFAFDHATGRHNLPGTFARLPLPEMSTRSKAELSRLVRQYHSAAERCVRKPSNKQSAQTRMALLEIDACILEGYGLPPRLERDLLNIFFGKERVGVPFKFDKYFPEDFEPWIPLHEYLSEEYRCSTAGQLRERHRDVASESLQEVLKEAVDAFEG